MIEHQDYANREFSTRFINHRDIKNLVFNLNGIFSVSEAGKSVQGREIFCVKIGKGRTKIMLWSQMHGDEPTATLAMLDLFNFFKADDHRNTHRLYLLNNCTLYFVPMLNPDGAEVLERRNAQGIDINRDFLAQQSPEGKVLFEMQQLIKPDFAFNLHDQHSLWGVSGSKKPATISLLAPPANAQGRITAQMLKAIQLVCGMSMMLKQQIPGHVGRWNDGFEPRAFGDNFQNLGTSTILIESGGFYRDPERQVARKLNFELILFALDAIATGHYAHFNEGGYDDIPANNKEIFHLLIKNCSFSTADSLFKADIGLNYTETIDHEKKAVSQVYQIADLGDLSTWGAYTVLDAQGASVVNKISIDHLAHFSVEVPYHPIFFKSGIIIHKNN